MANSTTYWREVTLRFQTYNGLFLELPFEDVRTHGILLPLFARHCKDGLYSGNRPDQIVEDFFRDQNIATSEINDMLYAMLQFAERQIVLFDAVEDASYEKIHDVGGPQSLSASIQRIHDAGRTDMFREFLEQYHVRIVLTAHPTQFYPAEVLGIISDLESAVRRGGIDEVYELLLQMGKTRFRNRTKPTPEDEARGLMWYLENIFYHIIPETQSLLDAVIQNTQNRGTNVELGFWPGGDRDGNPFVTPQTTLQVARLLRDTILRCYDRDLQEMARRLTFSGVIELVEKTIKELAVTRNPLAVEYDDSGDADGCLDRSEQGFDTATAFLDRLFQIQEVLHSRHQGLFSRYVEDLIRKVRAFGFHFAALDLRQDSRVHGALAAEIIDGYADLSAVERIELLNAILSDPTWTHPPVPDDADSLGVLGSLRAARQVQRHGGEKAIHRYIISNTKGAADVLEILMFAQTIGWNLDQFSLDIVPLFETVGDLLTAAETIGNLFRLPVYRDHLKTRGNHQTIMLGFSDGTKDGGYVAANWNIYRTKQELTKVGQEFGIRLTFFDGRGGPPARGGGNTHRFYRSLGPDIAGTGIHLTVQGQTVSSKYGTRSAATHNLGQIVSAGLLNHVFSDQHTQLSQQQLRVIGDLAADSRTAYVALRDSTAFVPFLEQMSPLTFYGQSNIGSRPTKRSGGALTLDSLRAIPFVGSWSQMKLNVPGYYGLGSAVQQAVQRGDGELLETLYQQSLFFRTLMDNSMQSLSKTMFELTRFIQDDPSFGELWRSIQHEANRSRQALLEISGETELLQHDPVIRDSIRLREELILPVAVIQQYALIRTRSLRRTTKTADQDSRLKELGHLIIKSMAASVNAARNSV